MFLKARTVFLGLLMVAYGAQAQQQTISARPGLVNYVEGEAYLDGYTVDQSSKQPIFMNAGDEFATASGKAEILLMPGVFLRVGDHTQVRMTYPSLVETRLEILEGETIIEAVGLLKGSQIIVTDQGAVATIQNNGLYRIKSGFVPEVGVYQGLLNVAFNGQSVKLGKGRATRFLQSLTAMKMNETEEDDLYAWSSVRSQYDAAASYQAAMNLASAGQNQSGWYYFNLFDCWAWLPSGQFFSPFGWGFYPTSTVWRAPVVKCTVLRGGHWGNGPKPIGGGHNDFQGRWVGVGSVHTVAIDRQHPPALNFVAGTPEVANYVRSTERSSKFMSSLLRGTGDRVVTAHVAVPQAGGRASKGGNAGSRGSSGSSRAGSGGSSRSSGGSHK